MNTKKFAFYYVSAVMVGSCACFAALDYGLKKCLDNVIIEAQTSNYAKSCSSCHTYAPDSSLEKEIIFDEKKCTYKIK